MIRERLAQLRDRLLYEAKAQKTESPDLGSWHHGLASGKERAADLVDALLADLRGQEEPKERELCSHCGGDGVVKIHHGVSVCPQCHGDCWQPPAAFPERRAAT
jgi:hypothetical protein